MPPRKPPYFYALSVLIILAAAFMRLHLLGGESLGMDELATWEATNGGTVRSVIRLAPLNWLLLDLLVVLPVQNYLGESEFVLRLPAALMGVIAVAGMITAGRTLYNVRIAFLGAALMGISWAGLTYSQEARAYAFLLAFVTLAATFCYRIVRGLITGQPLRRRDVLAYQVCAYLAGMTHFFGLMAMGLMAALLIVVSLRLGRGRGYLLLAHAAIAAASLPAAPFVLRAFQQRGTMTTIDPPLALPLSVLEFMGWAFNEAGVVGGAILALWAVAVIVRGRQRGRLADWYVIGWLVIPFVVTYLASVLLQPILIYRYLIYLLPPIYLLTARALDVVADSPRQAVIGGGVLIAFLVGQLLIGQGYYSHPQRNRTDMRSGLTSMAAQLPDYPHSRVILMETEWREGFFDYYFIQAGLHPDRPDLILSPDQPVERQAGTLDEVLTCEDRYLWLITRELNFQRGLLDEIEGEFDLITSEPYHGGEVLLYERAACPE